MYEHRHTEPARSSPREEVEPQSGFSDCRKKFEVLSGQIR
jgi:hypothetical protein